MYPVVTDAQREQRFIDTVKRQYPKLKIILTINRHHLLMDWVWCDVHIEYKGRTQTIHSDESTSLELVLSRRFMGRVKKHAGSIYF